MELPLISADQTFGLSAVIMVIVAAGLWAESKSWGQKIGGPLLLIALAKSRQDRSPDVGSTVPVCIRGV